MAHHAAAILLAIVCSASAAGVAEAEVFLSQKEALALAFPDADEVRDQTFILTPEQSERIEKLARSPLESKIVTLHSGWKDGKLQGHAFIEIHTVRTLPEAFMVVIEPGGEVRSLRVLAFYEPQEYLPAKRWYRQFEGKALDEPIRVGNDIHGVMGATLSTRAVSEGVRRALALHAVLVGDPSQRGAAHIEAGS